MGLEEDEDFHLLEDARCQVRAAVDSLKDSSLLLEGFDKEFVKMHDMVRDIGLWITSKGENEFELRACTRLERNTKFERAIAISLIDYNTKQLPDKLLCPRLNILLLGGIQSSKNISNALFKGMNCLKVLSLLNIILSTQSLKLLTNLRTLYLENCDFSDDLSSLGKLKRLETLSFYRCGINALPSELGEMASLKMLDLTGCDQLQQIPPNVIRRLSKLEELIISSSFKNWDVEGTTSEISNANLSELNSLPRLVNLSLKLNSNHLPKGFVFPEHLRRYFIEIGNPYFSAMTPGRTLAIKDLNASSMNALKSLFHTVEYLSIESCEMECIVDTICEGPNQNLVCLSIARDLPQLESLPQLKQVFGHGKGGDDGDGNNSVLSKLRNLILKNLPELVSLGGGNSSSVWPSLPLERLYVLNCPKLKLSFFANVEANVPAVQKLQNLQILSLRYWNAISFDGIQGLSNLEELEIKNCGGIQEVIKLEGLLTIKEEQQDLLLPRLKKMLLIDLLELRCIWKGTTKLINLNNLEDLKVIRCKKLTHLFTPTPTQSLQKLKFLEIERCDELEHLIVENAEEQVLSESHPQPLCFPKPNVVKVKVGSCNKLKCLFHVDRWNAVSIFLRLEELELKNCGGLQEVFNFEGFLTREGEQQDEFFPRLRKMCLVELHELTYIWKGPIQLINLNNLEDLKVVGCKKMMHLFTPALAQSLQKLKFLEIERCDELEHIIVENVEEQVSSENHLQPLCFPKLIRVNVKYCNKLKYLFPMTIADSLLELKILIVKENSQLMEVFTHEGDAGAQKDVTLPLLEFMGLKGLPSLVNFCPKNYQFILLKWRKLRVESCKNMRTTFTRTPDRSVLINGEVAQIDEPTGTSTISPVLTICPANNDIIWDSGGYLSPDGLYFYVEFERC
ncbi:probable disease resistance protein At4g27220 [Quercus lobata]|uniref:probable disease resistance protein At4g27220 n=1 Tax=Quercus lobata TaxID=97700 RepID=UPI001244AA94|nr:probable disease resistance protein At4g27220 [Quercus lobata]